MLRPEKNKVSFKCFCMLYITFLFKINRLEVWTPVKRQCRGNRIRRELWTVMRFEKLLLNTKQISQAKRRYKVPFWLKWPGPCTYAILCNWLGLTWTECGLSWKVEIFPGEASCTPCS